MSKQVTGIVSWLRTWFDDIYAFKGQGGNISFDDVYPVGSVYISVSPTNPSALFGGNWEPIEGQFLLGAGEVLDSNDNVVATYSAGDTGGSKDSVVVEHNHGSAWKQVSSLTAGSSYHVLVSRNDSGATVGNSTGTIANEGVNGTDANMPPYLAVYIWKRVSGGTVQKALSLITGSSILSRSTSANNSSNAVLTATYTENGNGVSGKTVTFTVTKDATGLIIDTLTATTNGNGVATTTYNSQGVGDITVTASCSNETATCTIEDCIYANMTQIDVTRSGSTTYGWLDSGRISSLPSVYSIEFDMKTSTAPTSGNEHRMYWCPTNQYNNGTQPQNALLVGYCYSGGTKIEYGKRLSGTTSSTVNISATVGGWNSVKIEKVNTSGRCDFYIDGTYRDYYTFTGMDNYTEWGFPYILWSNTTFSVRNIKIKPL